MNWKDYLGFILVGLGLLAGLALLMTAIASPTILIVYLILKALT